MVWHRHKYSIEGILRNSRDVQEKVEKKIIGLVDRIQNLEKSPSNKYISANPNIGNQYKNILEDSFVKLMAYKDAMDGTRFCGVKPIVNKPNLIVEELRLYPKESRDPVATKKRVLPVGKLSIELSQGEFNDLMTMNLDKNPNAKVLHSSNFNLDEVWKQLNIYGHNMKPVKNGSDLTVNFDVPFAMYLTYEDENGEKNYCLYSGAEINYSPKTNSWTSKNGTVKPCSIQEIYYNSSEIDPTYFVKHMHSKLHELLEEED